VENDVGKPQGGFFDSHCTYATGHGWRHGFHSGRGEQMWFSSAASENTFSYPLSLTKDNSHQN